MPTYRQNALLSRHSEGLSSVGRVALVSRCSYLVQLVDFQCQNYVMSFSCLICPQEDADAGIAFVQTSAQLISAGNAMSVDATGAVAEHSGSRGSPAAALDSQVMSVSADGRMHVEM